MRPVPLLLLAVATVAAQDCDYWYYPDSDVVTDDNCPCPFGYYEIADADCSGFCAEYAYARDGRTGDTCMCETGVFYGYHLYYDGSELGIEPGVAVCGPCGAGRYVDASATACQTCVEDNYAQLCPLCPVGKYKALHDTFVSTSECLDCAADRTSSADRQRCVCFDGQYESVGVCSACPESYVSNPDRTGCECPPDTLDSGGTCVACGAHSTAIAGECFCDAGYTGQLCEPCSVDTYKDVLGDTACYACPDGSVAPPGSTQHTDCVCDRGRFRVTGGACELCPVDTYKEGANNDACRQCALGMHAPTTGSTTCEPCGDTTVGICGKFCIYVFVSHANACALCCADRVVYTDCSYKDDTSMFVWQVLGYNIQFVHTMPSGDLQRCFRQSTLSAMSSAYNDAGHGSQLIVLSTVNTIK